MKKPYIIGSIFLLLLLGGLGYRYFTGIILEITSEEANREVVIYDDLSDSYVPYSPKITANFLIYTNETKRTFNNAMYFNLDERAYIDSTDSTQINVTDKNVTWGQFFDTLPFKLDLECLVTGLGEVLCKDTGHYLVFMLNGNVVEDVLNFKIKEGDKLLVSYGVAPYDLGILLEQYKSIL